MENPEEIQNRPADPFVRDRSAAGTPPGRSVTLSGLFGDSDRPGCKRLYLTSRLDYFAEFRTEDVVAVEDIPPERPPFVGLDATRVSLLADATVDWVRRGLGGGPDPFLLEARDATVQPQFVETWEARCPGITEHFGESDFDPCRPGGHGGHGGHGTFGPLPTQAGRTCATCAQGTCVTCEQGTCVTCVGASCVTCQGQACVTMPDTCQSCAGTCDARCGAGTGTCASCGGSCDVSCASCNATCEWTCVSCRGTCDVSCGGTCGGTCDSCDTCGGTCQATCETCNTCNFFTCGTCPTDPGWCIVRG